LSDTVYSPSTYGVGPIYENPQIINDTLSVLDDTSSVWMLIADTIAAAGGEKYITIGNFFSDQNSYLTITGYSSSLPDSSVYYYIDDVFIYCVDVACDTSWLGSDKSTYIGKINIYPNPSRGHFNIEHDLFEKMPGVLELYDLCGRLVYKKQLGREEASEQLDLSAFADGIYTYRIFSESRLVGAGKLSFQK
jgi:hypothetical protein